MGRVLTHFVNRTGELQGFPIELELIIFELVYEFERLIHKRCLQVCLNIIVNRTVWTIHGGKLSFLVCEGSNFFSVLAT